MLRKTEKTLALFSFLIFFKFLYNLKNTFHLQLLQNISYTSRSAVASQVVLVVKNPPTSAGGIRDVCSIPSLGRYPRGGHGNPLQCSCLENPLDRGA